MATTMTISDGLLSRGGISDSVLEFCKVRNVKSPVRGTDAAAGIDLFVPNDLVAKDIMEKNPFGGIRLNNKEILVDPHARVKIPCGIHFKIDRGWALIASDKSGVSTKTGLCAIAGIIDSDYQGEVHICLVNTNRDCVTIDYGMKILQLLLVPVALTYPVEVSSLDALYGNVQTQRGNRGFGDGTGTT
jgi:dUTP pyrophosphatase